MARGTARGRRKPRSAGPQLKGLRTCLGCRERFERETLIRVVCSPEGEVVVDRFLKAPGRGAHVCYEHACLEAAVSRRAFARAFKRALQPVTLDGLLAQLKDALDVRITNALALGMRARHLVSGTDTVYREISRINLVLLANDVADGTAERLTRRSARNDCPVMRWADGLTLGRALGKFHRVVVGVKDMRLAQRVLLDLKRRDRIMRAV